VFFGKTQNLIMKTKKLPIKHIGNVIPICRDKKHKDFSEKSFGESKHFTLREDLGYDRYRQLGIIERFRNEIPYRICERCLMIIFKRERRDKRHKFKRWTSFAKKHYA